MTKVKICGLSTVEALTCAIQAGADYLGLVFAESPRQVTIEQASHLLQQVPIPKTVQTVGVFVSPTRHQLLETQRLTGIDLVQIHGELPALQDLPFPVIHAQAATQTLKLDPIETDYILLDAPATSYQGGNGRPFDWSSIDPTTLPAQKLWLAGGLNANNVQRAIHYFHPFVVDVSSGVETNGQKDCQKIQAFCQKVKENPYVSRT
ncbi:phosphoribosylanthranilate isomerase [Enterococcus camelliae]|uniref:N-(5'-phosphoribosyl)anthranilate isomerase n=1 Tax=Enterococcus camelliae TaxID=453959 RepID=A0ABW5TG01_9ENTE